MVIKTGKVTVPKSIAGDYAYVEIADVDITADGKAVVTTAELDNLSDTRGQMEFWCHIEAGILRITGEKEELYDDTDVFYMYDTDGTGGGSGGIGGSIADTQIAYGSGTDITGSADLRYFSNGLRLGDGISLDIAGTKVLSNSGFDMLVQSQDKMTLKGGTALDIFIDTDKILYTSGDTLVLNPVDQLNLKYGGGSNLLTTSGADVALFSDGGVFEITSGANINFKAASGNNISNEVGTGGEFKIDIGNGNTSFKVGGNRAVNFPPLGTAPSSPAAGDVYCDSVQSNHLFGYDGGGWVDMMTSGGAQWNSPSDEAVPRWNNAAGWMEDSILSDDGSTVTIAGRLDLTNTADLYLAGNKILWDNAGTTTLTAPSIMTIEAGNDINIDAQGSGTVNLRQGSGAAILIAAANQAVNFPPKTTPTSPNPGDVYYDSGTNKLRCYDGSIWNDLF